jgi:TonB family protein
VTDENGRFKLGNLPGEADLVVSFVGYKSKVIKAVFDKEMTISLVTDTVKTSKVTMSPPPPPPPPPPAIKIKGVGPEPLIVVDGIITDIAINKIDPETIQSINVLKDKTATDKYGDKGKDGVIEVTKKDNRSPGQDKEVLSSTGTPPPPPPGDKKENYIVTTIQPHKGLKIQGDGPPPLIVLDGNIKTEEELDAIDHQSIEFLNVDVLKGESAITKYGDKGKNGVVEITSKKIDKKESENNISEIKVTAIGSGNGNTNMIDMEPRPLILVDGVISDIDINSIDVNTIESVSVLKNISATNKYGEKGKNGVIEIVTKKVSSISGSAADQKAENGQFVVVEEMPVFPGGESMSAWISDHLEYPGKAYKDKISGVVYVNFVINSTGKVKDVAVSKSVHPLLDAEAVRVVSSMPDWKPGKQNGKGVPVSYNVPVEFKMWGKIQPAESK